ncbi:carbonic anhydrase-like [Ostrea edulis]|uniref:carbonic anhydrase-like n=1 Tax=Ostrea edulis TaxID=37623 RepID=UPI0024AED940|nr:carbonic anhydrase-like [Ostrea edulis]
MPQGLDMRLVQGESKTLLLPLANLLVGERKAECVSLSCQYKASTSPRLLQCLQAAAHAWDYSDPASWNSTYSNCGGTSQSPIALTESSMTPASFEPFSVTGDNVTLTETLSNNGHSAVVAISQTITVTGGGLGGTFKVAQFHFHWGNDSTTGSEHTLNGQQYPMELHIVTYNSSYADLNTALPQSDGLAVLGFFFQISSSDNPNFAPIVSGLSSIAAKDATHSITGFMLKDLMTASMSKFYRYKGSLTTPTCDESVTWTVFAEALSISETQLATFRTLYEDSGSTIQMVDNYRPTLALNGRTVNVYSNSAQTNIIGLVLLTSVQLSLYFLSK